MYKEKKLGARDYARIFWISTVISTVTYCVLFVVYFRLSFLKTTDDLVFIRVLNGITIGSGSFQLIILVMYIINLSREMKEARTSPYYKNLKRTFDLIDEQATVTSLADDTNNEATNKADTEKTNAVIGNRKVGDDKQKANTITTAPTNKASRGISLAEKRNALKLMLINLDSINGYYIWSQKQARRSFGLVVAMCICGFLLITIEIIIPIAYKFNMAVTLSPTIDGAIAELIAGTALIVYGGSLSQLNYYHKALHEDELFLSSVNLPDRFSKAELPDEVLKELIQSQVQMNILCVERDEGAEKTATRGKK